MSFFSPVDFAMDSEIYPNLELFQFTNILNPDLVRMYGVILAEKDGVEVDRWFIQTERGGSLTASSAEKFLTFLRDKRLFGYNSFGFDNPVMNKTIRLIKEGKSVVHESHVWAQRIIRYGSPYKMPYEYRSEAFSLVYPKDDEFEYTSVDLARVITGNGGRFPSLKAVGVAMGWHKLQDLPLNPLAPVPIGQLNTLINYGWNDVDITRALALDIEAELVLRQNLSEFFETPLLPTLNSSRSRLTNVLFEKLYPTELQIEQDYINRKKRTKVRVADIVADNVEFRSKKLSDFLSTVKQGVINPGERKALDYRVEYNGCVYQLGVGGLHSVDGPGLFRTSDTVRIIDADVTSYYPAIILNLELAPEHLDKEEFLSSFNEIIVQRVEAKRAGNMVKSDGLKITINGMTGKFNSEFWKVFDPSVYYAMTLNGQLYLLMLVEMLVDAGIQPISANTDGVTSLVPVELLGKYREVCTEWEQKTKFGLEFAAYEMYARRDVNNYLTRSNECWWENGRFVVSPKQKVKQKGVFVERPGYDKNHDALCVRKAVLRNLLDGVPLRETIESCGIHDYMYSQNVGSQFSVWWISKGTEVEVQRKNRYYIVKPSPDIPHGALEKRKNNKATALVARKTLFLANDITDDMPEPNYDYYEAEAKNLLFSVVGQPRLI